MKYPDSSSNQQFYNYVTFLVSTLILTLVFLSEILMAQEVLKVDNTTESANKIFVVTNRSLIEADASQLVFDNELDEKKKHSFLTATLVDQQWTYQQEESLHQLFAQSSNENDWLFFVHGDGKSLQLAVERANEIQKLHNINVLVYAWPSRDEDLGGIKNFKNSYKNVELSASMLHSIIAEIVDFRVQNAEYFENYQLSMFMHSLGNYYMEQMVDAGYLNHMNQKVFDNIILNAAAVEQEDHNVWVEKINMADRIYINSNDDDISLSGLRFLTKLGRQLGESALAPYAKNAIYVNFTDAVGFPGSMGPSHSYYFASITDKSENIKQYYSTIFHGQAAPLFDSELFSYVPKEEKYSIRF